MPIYLNKSSPTHAISVMCKTMRREQHITQAALGQMLGTTQGEISYIERGLLPDVDMIIKLADLYKETQYYQNQTLVRR